MTITLHWWYVPVLFFLIPLVYTAFRRPTGDWDFRLDIIAIATFCWAFALAFTLGKLF